MDVREKLAEVLAGAPYNIYGDRLGDWCFTSGLEISAEYLMARGVTLLQTQIPNEGPMTNADKIRGMSDGDLFDLLSMIYATGKADGFALAEKQWRTDFELTSKWLMQEADNYGKEKQ